MRIENDGTIALNSQQVKKALCQFLEKMGIHAVPNGVEISESGAKVFDWKNKKFQEEDTPVDSNS